jgi:hypothetical protein
MGWVLAFNQVMCGFLLVDHAGTLARHMNVQGAIAEGNDGLGWDFEVGVLALGADQQVVRMDFVDGAEGLAVEADDWRAEADLREFEGGILSREFNGFIWHGW